MGQPSPRQPQGQPNPADGFFNNGPMRYPTMSGMGVDAFGLSGANQPVAAAGAPEEAKDKEGELPKGILKQPTQYMEHGNKPPALPKDVAFEP